MKLSWVLVLVLLVLVAIFSVQNADVMTVRFFAWEFTMSAALVIQLAALFGAFVGLAVGASSRRATRNHAAPSSTPLHEPQKLERPPEPR